MKVRSRSPRFEAEFDDCISVSSRYSYRNNGWGKPKISKSLVKVEVNSYELEAEDDYFKYRMKGPNATASAGFNFSDRNVGGKLELSGGKISCECAYVKSELNPNLTTSASIGSNGFETRVGGTGVSLSRRGASFHTPLGSVSLRNPF